MNKRVLDGGAIWTSKKIAALDPAWIKPEYTWLYCLAASNGVFEIDPRVIWARCYAFSRPDIDVDKVAVILKAFEAAKLLFVWQQDGKTFGYWTNSDLPGRLPRKSWQERDRKNGNLPPDPPQDALRTFLSQSARQERAGVCKSVSGSGSGSGSGFGSGKNISSQEKASCDQIDSSKKAKKETKDSRYSEAARRLAQFLLVRVAENLKRLNAKSKLLDSDKEQHAGVKRWTPDIELMLRLDGYSEVEVRALIEWSQADSFWWKNIRSGRKLRAQAEELSVRMKDEQAKKAAVGKRAKPLDQQYSELARRRAGQVN